MRALKGPSRPALPEGERALLLAALPCVDAVLVFDDLTPLAALEVLRPDVLCRGTDQAPPGGPDPEGALVAGYGGRVVFLPRGEGLSDRELLRRRNQPRAG